MSTTEWYCRNMSNLKNDHFETNNNDDKVLLFVPRTTLSNRCSRPKEFLRSLSLCLPRAVTNPRKSERNEDSRPPRERVGFHTGRECIYPGREERGAKVRQALRPHCCCSSEAGKYITEQTRHQLFGCYRLLSTL